jgi:monoterpene epsilon-lactone hydrolase
VRYEPVDASGVAAEWTLPAEADPYRVLLYFHGGGSSIGSIASHRKVVGHLARAAGVKGLSVDYRLAPENPVPGGPRRWRHGVRLVAARGLRGEPHRPGR